MPDIQIFQIDPNTGLGSLALGNSPKRLSGIDLLAQIVALAYLRDPGQDVIDPMEGAGIRQDIASISITSNDQAHMLVMQRTKKIEAEIIARQQVGTGDPTEKLKSLVVIDIAADLAEAAVAARVKIINQAGQSTQILV